MLDLLANSRKNLPVQSVSSNKFIRKLPLKHFPRRLIEQKELLKKGPTQDLTKLKLNTERGTSTEKRGSLLTVPGRGEQTERAVDNQEPLKKILLPVVVAKENRNHRSQTTLKVRHKSNLRI